MVQRRGCRRRTVLASGAAGLTSLTGCLGNILDGGDEADDSSGGSTVKLGVLAPQSGSLETFGPAIVDAAKLVQRQITTADTDFELELSIQDTESDPETAASKGADLSESGCRAIVGPGSTESLIRLAEEVLVPDGIAACSPLAATVDSIDLDTENLLYTTAPRASFLGQALARPMALEGVESVALISADNRYGRQVAENAVEAFETRGTEVTASVTVDTEAASSSAAELETAMADDPEALAVGTGPVIGTQILTDYYDAYGEKPVYLTDRLRLGDLPSNVGEPMENAYVVAFKPQWMVRRSDDSDAVATGTRTGPSEIHRSFYDAFRAEYGRRPTLQAAQAFDATVPLFLAAVSPGESDGSVVGENVRKMTNTQLNYEGVYTYDSENYWTGLGDISDGVRNDYSGPTGRVQYSTNVGILEKVRLHAARFAPDVEHEFEEVLPIPL